MAFYSVRIDESGKEIETTRQTYRKYFDENDADEKVSSRQTCRSPINTFKTVRYVNSATFIEKDHEAIKKQRISEHDEDGNESDINSDTFDFSVDANEQQYQSHIATDKLNESVPVLELNSNESFPSSNNLTYSYRRVCEVTKIIQKPDAYKEWLDAKQTALKYQRKKQKKDKQKEQQAKEERKRLCEEKFNEWLARKAKEKINEQTGRVKSQSPPMNKDDISEPKTLLGSDQPDHDSNFKAWLEQKRQREKQQKEKINQELKREEELKNRRKQAAANVYEKWLRTAPQKPKPVPLNQGLFTLKGSVSEMYVNPIAWVTTDSDGSSKSL